MDLSRRLARFIQRIDNLVATIAAHDHGDALDREATYLVERVLIQLQLEWEHFVRNVILDSATGKFEYSSRPVVSSLPVRLGSREQVSHYLLTLYRNRKFEPDWYLPSDAIDAASKLGLSNYANLSAQLGISPWKIDDLRHVRNFIAHRSKRSALKLRDSGLVTSRDLNPVDCAFDYGATGTKHYLEWSNFIKYVATAMVK